jgi:outer membrane protein assembly factor BamB
VVWLFPSCANGASEPQRSRAVVDAAGRMYLSVQNRLHAFVAQDGTWQEAWKYETGGRIPAAPAIGPDGNLRVHSGDGHLHLVSPDGKRVGSPATVGEPLGWASPLVDRNNVTWICGYHGGLLRVDAESRVGELPYFRGLQRFDSTGLIHDDVLYLGSENACVYAIPLHESRGKNVWNHLAEEGRTGWYINSALSLGPGPTVIVASRDSRLYGFGLDGKKRWDMEMEGQMLGSPLVAADGSIYVGLSVIAGRDRPSGMFVRVDGVSHRIMWRYCTALPIESTPVRRDDGTLYFGDNEGTIHALDSDGNVRWTERLHVGVRSVGAIVGSDRLLFGLENGQYAALRIS